MNKEEAIKAAEDWLQHLDRQEQRAITLQVAARLAREGYSAQAQILKQHEDVKALNFYDADRLKQAVEYLLDYMHDGTFD